MLHMPKPAAPKRTANIALHVKLTEEEATKLRELAAARGGHLRTVVVDGMAALEEQGDLLRRMQAAERQAVEAASRSVQANGASETWKRACSSILGLLKEQAAKRALTPVELDIWTLAMGEPLLPPKSK